VHLTGTKRLRHPAVGDLDLRFETMELPADPGLALLLYTAEPGSETEQALTFLASWAAAQDQPAPASDGVRSPGRRHLQVRPHPHRRPSTCSATSAGG
jgi:hypothetical protein